VAGAKAELIEGLNTDLAGEYQAVITYLLYSRLVNGPLRPELSKFFESEIEDELGHAKLLSQKIVALGGTPATEPAEVKLSDDNREMLQIALQSEIDTIARYTQRIEQAEAVGELGLKVDLEDLVSDETQHKEDIERILYGWKD
jgi:bacterioferritin